MTRGDGVCAMNDMQNKDLGTPDDYILNRKSLIKNCDIIDNRFIRLNNLGITEYQLFRINGMADLEAKLPKLTLSKT